MTRVERFWAKVDKSGDCWLWTGRREPKGYGRFRNGGPVMAHRFAYELLVGPVPPGLELDHTCLNTRQQPHISRCERGHFNRSGQCRWCLESERAS